jgi:hypothetical protein
MSQCTPSITIIKKLNHIQNEGKAMGLLTKMAQRTYMIYMLNLKELQYLMRSTSKLRTSLSR